MSDAIEVNTHLDFDTDEKNKVNLEVIQKALKDLTDKVNSHSSEINTNREIPGVIKFTVADTTDSAIKTALLARGYLPCLKETIGAVGSGATYRGEEYRELFNYLKTGWGNAGTEDFDSENTVYLPDQRGADGSGEFLRGKSAARTVGDAEADAYQGHYHQLYAVSWDHSYGGGGVHLNTSNANAANMAVGGTNGLAVRESTTDGINGTPRTANETRPKNRSINWIVSY